MRAKRVRALRRQFRERLGRDPERTSWEKQHGDPTDPERVTGFHVSRSEIRALKRDQHRAHGLARPRERFGVPEVEGAPKPKLADQVAQAELKEATAREARTLKEQIRESLDAAAGEPEPENERVPVGSVVVGAFELPTYAALAEDRETCERCGDQAPPMMVDGALVFTDPVMCIGCRDLVMAEGAA